MDTAGDWKARARDLLKYDGSARALGEFVVGSIARSARMCIIRF